MQNVLNDRAEDENPSRDIFMLPSFLRSKEFLLRIEKGNYSDEDSTMIEVHSKCNSSIKHKIALASYDFPNLSGNISSVLTFHHSTESFPPLSET